MVRSNQTLRQCGKAPDRRLVLAHIRKTAPKSGSVIGPMNDEKGSDGISMDEMDDSSFIKENVRVTNPLQMDVVDARKDGSFQDVIEHQPFKEERLQESIRGEDTLKYPDPKRVKTEYSIETYESEMSPPSLQASPIPPSIKEESQTHSVQRSCSAV